MSEIDVSCIIVNYNGGDLLTCCIRSLYDKITKPTVEVIVIDNASADGSQQKIREEFPRALLIENPENVGYGAAINIGLKQARGKFCVILNSDIEFAEDVVSPIIPFIRTHPDTGFVGCSIQFPDGTPQRSYFTFPSLMSRIAYFTGINKLINAEKPLKEKQAGEAGEFSVDVVCGAFLIIRRDLLQRIGGFDPDYFLYQEEADACFRLKKAGYRNVVFPQYSVMHHNWNSETPDNPIVFYHRNRSLLIYYVKNKSWITSVALWKINFIGTILQTVYIFFKFYQSNRKKRLNAYISVLKYHISFLSFLLIKKNHRINDHFS